jgi:hypothetical protein
LALEELDVGASQIGLNINFTIGTGMLSSRTPVRRANARRRPSQKFTSIR